MACDESINQCQGNWCHISTPHHHHQSIDITISKISCYTVLLFLSAFPCLLSTVLIVTIITLKYNWKKKEKGQKGKTVGQLLVLLGCQYLEGNEKRLKNKFKLNLSWREKNNRLWSGITGSRDVTSKFVADFHEPKNGLLSHFHIDIHRVEVFKEQCTSPCGLNIISLKNQVTMEWIL